MLTSRYMYVCVMCICVATMYMYMYEHVGINSFSILPFVIFKNRHTCTRTHI